MARALSKYHEAEELLTDSIHVREWSMYKRSLDSWSLNEIGRVRSAASGEFGLATLY